MQYTKLMKILITIVGVEFVRPFEEHNTHSTHRASESEPLKITFVLLIQ